MISLQSLRSSYRSLSRTAALAACALTLVTTVHAAPRCDDSRSHAPRPEFSALYVFGDSLSDTGRFFAATGGYPPAPYYQGRFSNGPVWVEHLAPALGLRYDPAKNFAWAGANTGRLNANGPFPGMLDELDSYVATLGRHRRADPRALYVVFGGGNDFFRIVRGADPTQVIPEAVTNLVQLTATLRSLGARHILVVDLPDIGLTPAGAGNRAGATYLSTVFNQALDDGLAAAGLDDVKRLSVFDLIDAFCEDPAAYGFTNVTDRGILSPTGAAGFLFWDDIHPTTEAHALVAEAMLAVLTEERSNGHSHHHRAAHAVR